MRNKIIVFILVLIVILIAFNSLRINYFNESLIDDEREEDFQIEILVEDLDTPWAIDFLPNGDLIFTERIGRISIWNGEKKIIGEIDVSERSESGLLGIAVDPDFNSNKFIYVYYTHDDGNRISRLILNDEEKLENEVILIDNIPSARFHDGGRIKFGPDGKLYAVTGDATDPSASQDINSLAGKILRINKDGSIPEDNPYENYVYSYGHRNPQGIDWHPETNRLYSAEHGPSQNDEINLIEKGGNYGWPVKCSDQEGEIDILPLRCYTEFTLAPSGISFYKDALYIGGLRGNQIRKIEFDVETIVAEEKLFDDLGRIRDVSEHDGFLYIATSNRDGRGNVRDRDDKIIRVKF